MLQRSRVAMVIACVDATRNDSVGGYSIHGPLTSHLDKTLQEANISLEEAPTPLVVICDPGKVGSLIPVEAVDGKPSLSGCLTANSSGAPGNLMACHLAIQHRIKMMSSLSR